MAAVVAVDTVVDKVGDWQAVEQEMCSSSTKHALGVPVAS
jgi:hypothetical protein